MKHFEVQTPAAPTKPNKYILRIASAFAHTTFRGSSTCSNSKVHEHFANQAFKGFNHFPLTLTCYQAHEIPQIPYILPHSQSIEGANPSNLSSVDAWFFLCPLVPTNAGTIPWSGHKVRASASSFWEIELDKKLKNNQYRLDQSFFYNSTGCHAWIVEKRCCEWNLRWGLPIDFWLPKPKRLGIFPRHCNWLIRPSTKQKQKRLWAWGLGMTHLPSYRLQLYKLNPCHTSAL